MCLNRFYQMSPELLFKDQITMQKLHQYIKPVPRELCKRLGAVHKVKDAIMIYRVHEVVVLV